MTHQFLQEYEKHLFNLKETKKLRELISQKQENDFLNFSSNDYLNLSRHPDLIEAAYRAGLLYGVGSTGSRLLSGNCSIFTEFETQIATDKNTEKALIFSSGYQANSSALASLCDTKTRNNQSILFFDKLNHSSLYQAAFLSKAQLIRYKHRDMNDLIKHLEAHKNDNRKKFIVTETLFGMDGDIAPLEDLVFLSNKYNTLLYLDEAHATGIYGKNGYGLSTTLDLSLIPHIIMGTFSKALGSCGAYIASSSLIHEYLINTCSGFIFTTALSPMIIAAAQCAWNMLKDLSHERKKLEEMASYLRARLVDAHFNIGTSSTHIIPIILGPEQKTLHTKEFLEKKKIFVSAVRPPSVPPNTSRIRIALSSKHTKQDLNTLLDSLFIPK